ncbi:MAG: YceD family protein [Sphingomicrobium sp.]
MTDRFAHQLRLDQIGEGQRLDLVAGDAERGLIAKRLGLASLGRFEAHVCLSRTGAIVRAEGRLLAALSQSCVVTGDAVAAHIDEPFALLFVPEPSPGAIEDEVELGEADCDTAFYDGAMIDLGTALADTLALALDPYPRSAGADAALKEAGVMSEEQASPFAVLAKLRKTDET